MKISAASMALAIKIQEASDLSSNDIASRLRDAIQDYHRGSNSWGYYLDYFGDAESGDVIYSCDGDTMRAPYEISAGAGAAKCVIDFENAEDVVPRTVYEPEADEQDHYAAMEESLRADGLYDRLPLYERFISKSERDKADSGDFAGKGKSFPILKPEDVMAAVRSIGRAGSGNLGPSGIKARIIAIAKRKGWTKYLPKAWQTDEQKEARVSQSTRGGLSLVESAATTEAIQIREARADYEIKLIAPGKGSSAFYPAEVLKRDGPKVFGAGTHVYLNHPTAVEEAQRPEGDVANLAGVLTTQAQYHESHAKGPGLYARMKVFADHAQMVEEKAPHVGMSIRAAGVAEAGRMRDGVPVLKELTHAESVDVVTRAGAGGMILTEAARSATQEVQMTEADVQRLVEAGIKAALADSGKATAALQTRALRGDAREEATRLLESITLPQASKAQVINRLIEREIPAKDGEIDREAFKALVEAAAKAEGQYLTALMGDSARPRGMGAAAGVTVIDPKEAAERKRAQEQAAKDEFESDVRIYESLGMPKEAAAIAARGRVA